MNKKSYFKQKSEQFRQDQIQILINDRVKSEYHYTNNRLDADELTDLLNDQIEQIFQENQIKHEKKESSSSVQEQSSKINLSRLNLYISKLNFSNQQTKDVYILFKKILRIFEIFCENSKEKERNQKVDILIELIQKMVDDMKEGLGDKIESLKNLFKLDLYTIQLEQQLKDKKMINKRKELLLRLQNQKKSFDKHMQFQSQLSEQNLSNLSINCNDENQDSQNEQSSKKKTVQSYVKTRNQQTRNKRHSAPQQIYTNYKYIQNKRTNLFQLTDKINYNRDNYILLDKEKMELSDQFDEFIKKNQIKNSIVQIYDKNKIIKRTRAFQNKFFKAISEQILNDCDTRERINLIEKNLLKIIQKIKLLGNKKDLIREIQIQKQEIQILQQKLKITGNVSQEIKKLNDENSTLKKKNEDLQLEYKVLQSRFELVQSSKEYNMLDENYSISEDYESEPIVKNERSIIEQKIQKYNDGLSNLDAVVEEQSDYERSEDSIKVNKNFFSTKLYEIYFNFNFNQEKQGAVIKKSRSTLFCQDQIFRSLYKKDENEPESPHLRIPKENTYEPQRSKSFNFPKFLDNLTPPEPKINSTVNKKIIHTDLKNKITKLQSIKKKFRTIKSKLILLSKLNKKSKILQAKLKIFKKKKIIQKIENKSDIDSLSSESSLENQNSLKNKLQILIYNFAQQNNLQFLKDQNFSSQLQNLLSNLEIDQNKSNFNYDNNNEDQQNNFMFQPPQMQRQIQTQQNSLRQTDFTILKKAFVSLSEILQNLTSNVNFLQKKFKENYKEKLTNEILLNIQKNIQQLKKQTKLVKYFILDQKDSNKSENLEDEFHQLTSSNYQPLLYQEKQEIQGPQRTFSAPRNKEQELYDPKQTYETSIYDHNSSKNYLDTQQKYNSCLDLLKTMSMIEIPNNESNIYSANSENLSLDHKIDVLMQIASRLFSVQDNKLQFIKSQILEHFYNPNYLERSLRNSYPQSEVSTKRNFESEDTNQKNLILKLKDNIKSLENKLREQEDEYEKQQLQVKFKEKEAKFLEQNKKLKKSNLVHQRRSKNMIATINGKNQIISALEKDKQELETKFTELQVELDHLMESQEYQGIQQSRSQRSLIQVLKLENKKLSEQVDSFEQQMEILKSKQREKVNSLEYQIESLKQKLKKMKLKLKKEYQQAQINNYCSHKSEMLIRQSKELQQMDSLKRQKAQKNQTKQRRLFDPIKADIKPKRTSTLLTKSMLLKGKNTK